MKPLLAATAGFLLLVPAVRLPAQDARPVVRPPDVQPREAGPGPRETALADVFADYGRLIGKKIILDNTVNPNQPFPLPDLDGVGPQPRANLIEKTLFLHNYTLVDADKDTVAVLGPGKNPRSIGLPLYTKPDELPSGERVFSYLFKLEHRNAIEIAGCLQQMIPAGSSVNFTADEKSRSVIATAPTSIMRTVLRVVAALDAATGADR